MITWLKENVALIISGCACVHLVFLYICIIGQNFIIHKSSAERSSGTKKKNFRETATDVDVLKKKLIESQEIRELYKNECETSVLTIERRKMCRR